MTRKFGRIHTTPRWPATLARLGVAATVFLAIVNLGGVAQAQTPKPFMNYLKPTPITCSPLSSASWGVAGVLPRDLCNGIESAKGSAIPPDYYYWDGEIIKAKDGKYHMFHSTWAGSTGFQNWTNSDAFHSISQQGVLGPYARQDYVYSNNGSHKGHNVSAVELPDGSYAVVVGEIVPLTIYKSSSLDGPWTGCSPSSQVGASNVSLFPREDGKFQIVERNGTIAISDTLCGTYVKQKPTCSYTQNATDAQGNPVVGSIYPKRTSIPGVTNPTYLWQEDPHIWRSGGTYHVIYSGSGDRVGWHVYSPDGLTWKDNGYAWSPRDYQKIFCYEGSTTCTQWYKMERPGVVLEDGHPTHITWAVADVDKDTQIPAGSNHGSKIVVVPFDGVAFDTDFGTGGTSARGGSSGTGAGGGAGVGTGGAMGGSGGAGGNASGGTTGRDAGPTDVGQGGATAGATGVGGGGASGGTAGGTVAGSGGAGGTGSGGNQGTGGRTGSGGAGGTLSASGGTTASTGSGGSVSGSGGSLAGAGGSGSGGSSSQGGATTTKTSSSGCSCTIAAANAGVNSRWGGAMGALLALFALALVRRRTKA